MGTHNNQIRQWRVCRGNGGAVVVQCLHGGVVGARGVLGRAAVLVGWQRGIGGGEG
jgi:hypothetical protein